MREFTSLRRSDITALLDHVEDHCGPHQADQVLAIVRSVANWYAARHDVYLSPFVRNMRRVDPQARKRSRILTDAELRAIWKAAKAAARSAPSSSWPCLRHNGAMALIRMQCADLDGDVWRMPQEPRAKGVGGDLKLSPLALEIIHAQPKLASNPYVFAGRASGPFNGFAKAKIGARQGQRRHRLAHS